MTTRRLPPALVGKASDKGRHDLACLSWDADKTRSPHVPRDARKSRVEAPPAGWHQLHTVNGTRKYLTAGERDAFLREADLADRPVRMLCTTLAYANCWLSEARAPNFDRVDLTTGVLVFESLIHECTQGAAKVVACGSGRGRG